MLWRQSWWMGEGPIVTFRALLIAEVGANDQARKPGLQTLLRTSQSQMTCESRVRKNSRDLINAPGGTGDQTFIHLQRQTHGLTAGVDRIIEIRPDFLTPFRPGIIRAGRLEA
jgi:hypothetical protein